MPERPQAKLFVDFLRKLKADLTPNSPPVTKSF